MNDLSKLQKGILTALLAMTVLFAVLTGVVRSQKGVQFGDTLLRIEGMEEATVYTGTIRREPVTIRVPKGGEFVVEYIIEGSRHDVYTVKYPLESVQTEHGRIPGIHILRNGMTMFRGAYDPDGEILSWFNMDGEWEPPVTVQHDSHWDAHELTIGNVMYFLHGPELTARGSWGYYLLIVLMTALLAFDVWYPTALFYMQHACDVRDPEPSDFYITSQKISWVVYTCGLLIAHIYILTHIW